MNINKKHQYALSAMLSLGFNYYKGPIQLRLISQERGIPHSFLEQLILNLKKSGLVVSTRGAKGGYQLSVHPKKVTVFDIFSAIDPISCVASNVDGLSFFWNNLNAHINNFFNVSLDSLMSDVVKNKKVLEYSI